MPSSTICSPSRIRSAVIVRRPEFMTSDTWALVVAASRNTLATTPTVRWNTVTMRMRLIEYWAGLRLGEDTS